VVQDASSTRIAGGRRSAGTTSPTPGGTRRPQPERDTVASPPTRGCGPRSGCRTPGCTGAGPRVPGRRAVGCNPIASGAADRGGPAPVVRGSRRARRGHAPGLRGGNGSHPLAAGLPTTGRRASRERR
jgi:hypothetical protein